MSPLSPSRLPVKRELGFVYGLSLGLGVLLAAASVVGLATGLGGSYEPYPPSEAGLFAQDLVVLFVALPLLVASIWLARRGSVAGLLAWAGVLFYAAYTYYFMVIGAFTILFPVYIAIVALATYALLALLFALDAPRVAQAFGDRGPRRAVAAFFLVTVVLFIVLWGGLVASSLAAGETPDPVQHLVVAIDGAILLPILGFAGVQLLRRATSAPLLAGLLIVKAGLTGFTLAFTSAFAMWWAGEATPLDVFLVGVFSVMTIVAIGLWIAFTRATKPREIGAMGNAHQIPEGAR